MRLVPGLDRGMRVLDLLARRGEPISASALARELDIPRSAVYEIINTLLVHNAVRQHPGGLIGLGHQTLVLGSAYGASLDLVTLAQPIARDVMLACEETVQLGFLEDRHVVYLVKADSPRPVRLVSRVGSRVPAHCTALGKMLLASLPAEELDRRVGRVELEQLTPASITDPTVLRENLAEARAQGYAWEYGESNDEVACVAAPVRDADGRVVAAMSISAPVGRVTGRREELLTVLAGGADRLSASLGHSPR
ncbi:IclR family transcriptional regulator [Streptomyces tremellae]|uniref:IclR family transcriptional regulator n=1 Tax=Streptomyces tremellae TaxID=1124239 RepID=A0ABP7F584_9ACTN